MALIVEEVPGVLNFDEWDKLERDLQWEGYVVWSATQTANRSVDAKDGAPTTRRRAFMVAVRRGCLKQDDAMRWPYEDDTTERARMAPPARPCLERSRPEDAWPMEDYRPYQTPVTRPDSSRVLGRFGSRTGW